MEIRKSLTLDEKHKRVIEFIEPKPGDKILVIGTGVFPKIEFWLSQNFKCKNITSGDIDEKNVINGKKILPFLNFVKLDAQKNLPFQNKSFDKVILIEVLDHLKNERIALQEIRRVLEDSGILILSITKKRWFNIFNPASLTQHEKEYNEKTINRVLNENDFKIKRIFIGGNIYELFSLWVHLILKYFFNILRVEHFFQKRIDKSYKKNFKAGRGGTDIIIQACID